MITKSEIKERYLVIFAYSFCAGVLIGYVIRLAETWQ